MVVSLFFDSCSAFDFSEENKVGFKILNICAYSRKALASDVERIKPPLPRALRVRN
jgi:hypothetical protein